MQKQYSAVMIMIFLAHLTVASTIYGCENATDSYSPSNYRVVGLNSNEKQVVAIVNGTNVYGYDLGLENIALSHLAFLSAGSPGANEAANWIKQRFESFGLEAWLEPFQFYNWTLLSKPSLIIDEDEDNSTTGDQTPLNSFQSEHYSWPAPAGGVFADLVVLPLPPASNRSEIGVNTLDMTAWNAINTTGKIVLVGREIRWDAGWEYAFVDKLTNERPAAVVYTWWYSWMNFTPPVYNSVGGLPPSRRCGTYYWNLHIPVGFVNYGDGLWLRQREQAVNVSASFSLESVIGYGSHYNVIGKISGYQNPEKLVIVSSHYDTVMCNGFCDNGAGTAAIVELANVFSEAINRGLYKPRYTLLFVAFTGEEMWMVGSGNYLKQHKNDMPNTIAVINLDTIGNKYLNISKTDPAGGIDLDELVIAAGQDLNMNITAEGETGAGDGDSFRVPSEVNDLYYRIWGLDPGIGDAKPVNSSTMIFSSPSGWIHTAYDNSTSTQTFGWVTEDNLEKQVKVAALSIMRISAVPAAATTARVTPVLNITLITPPRNLERIQWGQMVVTGLQNLGINANLAILPWQQINSRVFAPSLSTRGETYADGGFDFNCVGWSEERDLGVDPDPYLWFHSSQFAPNGMNYYLWNNSENDYLCNAIRHETNLTKLLLEVRQWQALVYEEAPCVALYYYKNIVPMTKNLDPGPFLTNHCPRWPGVEAWTSTSGPLTSVTVDQNGLCNSYSPAHSGGDPRWLACYAPIYGETGGFGLLTRGPPSAWDMEPYMAYGNYTHSDDFRKWNFTIRPGIMFQNGEELDARDVVYTLRYSMTTAWSSTTGWYIREILGSNTSVYWAGEKGTPGASEPLNYYKVHFSLPDTWAYFLSEIGGASIMPASVIVNSSSGIPDYADWHPDPTRTASFQYTSFCTGDGSSYKYYGKNESLLTGSGPFGAGPYRFVNYDSGTNTIHLTKFAGYFNKAALEAEGKYKIVDYYVKLVTNINDAIHDLSTGSAQVLDSGYGFQDYVGHQINSSFCQWIVYDGFNVQELGFNMQHPIFGTGLGTPVGMANASRAAEAAKHMRRGIEYLFLKDTILKNMTHGYGTYGVTTSVTRATLFFNDQIVLRNDTVLNQRLLAMKEFEAAGYHFYVDLARTGENATTPSWCFEQYGFQILTSGADNVSVIFFALAPPGTGVPPPGQLPLVYLEIHGVKLEGTNETILYVYYNVTRCVQLGIDENSLALYFWNSTATSWSALSSTHLKLNSTHGLIFALAPHFSYFAVFGTLPRGGGIGTIEIIAIGAVAAAGVGFAVVALRRRGGKDSTT